MSIDLIVFLLVLISISGLVYVGSSVLSGLIPSETAELDRMLYRFYYRVHPQLPFINSYLNKLADLIEKNESVKFSPQSFLILKEMVTVLMFFLGSYIAGNFMGFLLAIATFIYPDVKLRGEILKQKDAMRRDFPEFVDLLALIVESGLDFNAAVEKISQSFVDGPLKRELVRITSLLKRGMRRKDVLTDWAEKWDLDEIGTFSSLIIQAEKTGASLGNVLKELSDRIRDERFAYVEKKASQLPVKLMLPLFIIFGSIMMIIFGLLISQMMGVL